MATATRPRVSRLVLSRRLGQSIRIGPEVTLTVVDIRGGQVQLAIEAPRAVRVLRAELAPFSIVNPALEAAVKAEALLMAELASDEAEGGGS